MAFGGVSERFQWVLVSLYSSPHKERLSLKLFCRGREIYSSSQAIVTCQRRHIATFVGRNILRAIGHRVAMFCDMLGVVGSSLKMLRYEST